MSIIGNYDLFHVDGHHTLTNPRDIEVEEVLSTPEIMSKVFSSHADKQLSQQDKINRLNTFKVIEAEIVGNIRVLQEEIEEDTGKRVILIHKEIIL